MFLTFLARIDKTSVMIKEKFPKILTYKNWLIPLGLALTTVIAYLPSLWYAFQFDDEPSILRFYDIRNKGFCDLFFTTSRWVSYWLNTIHYKLDQFQPFVYRRSNLIFHCISGILVYWLILSLLTLRPKNSWAHRWSRVIAGITCALFLLHPVQTQTVSYVIQGQLEGLSTLFCLAIVICFVFATQAKQHWIKFLYTAGMIALGIIACGTKEITIVLPFLTLLIDWFFIAQGKISELKKHWWMHAIIAITIWGCYTWLLGKNFIINVLALRVEHQNTIGNMITHMGDQKITPWPFFISQFKVALHYLFMFIWPFNMSVDYDWKLCNGIEDLSCLLPLLGLIAIFATIGYLLYKNRVSTVACGLLWFFICLAPRSTIMPSTELMADYKTYLASIGWLFVLAIGLSHLYEWLRNRWSLFKQPWSNALLIALCLGTLSALTWHRNKVWRSGLEFWQDVVYKSPAKARGYNNLGANLLAQNDIKQATWCFKKAIQLEPFTYPDPYNNLAAAYALQEKTDLAVFALRASLKINPYQPKAFNNLGIFLMKKNENDFAEKSFQQAISLAPHYGKAHFNLGRLYLKRNELRKAWQCFKDACTKADYDMDPEGVASYAQTSMYVQKFDDAIKGFQMLLNLMPDNQAALFGLANAYALNKKYQDAITLYCQLRQKEPYELRVCSNLTQAYIDCHQKPQALAIIKELEAHKLQYPGMAHQKAVCS